VQTIIQTQPYLITQPAELQKLANKLSQQAMVAVDTESNSLHAYQEQVCLIQFSIPGEDYLVDPLVLLDLTTLNEVFANPAIEKVFHAAEYDLVCLKRDFNFHFSNLFDTMLAARILGRNSLGLGALLEEHFGVKLDKRFQRANWGQRPLPGDLLAYARLDTHYLLELRNRLKTELISAGRWLIAEEDFRRLCKINGRSLELEENGDTPIAGARELNSQQYAVLLELCKYRDRVAKMQDRPLFKVISTPTLVATASACPGTLNELREIAGMTEGQIRRHGKNLIEAVQHGLAAKPVTPRRSARMDEAMVNRLERLREWRKVTARAMEVESDVVLPRDLMMEVAKKNPRSLERLGEVMADAPWRLEQYGEKILAVLRK
jgi:ribonuclease D